MKATKLFKYSAAVIVLSVLTTLTACGNKGGGSGDAQAQQCGVNVVCQNGIPVNGGATFFQAESQDWYGMIKLNWNFSALNQVVNQPGVNPYANNPYGNNQYGNTGYNNGYNYSGSVNMGYNYGYGGGYNNGYNMGMTSPIISYNGPVTSNGVLTIMQGMSLGMCQLPGGTYNLTTLVPGQWMSAMVYNLRMQATGPANVMLTLSQGQVSAKTGSQLGQTWSEVAPVGRIFGNVVIESVNGYPCTMSILVQ